MELKRVHEFSYPVLMGEAKLKQCLYVVGLLKLRKAVSSILSSSTGHMVCLCAHMCDQASYYHSLPSKLSLTFLKIGEFLGI